MTNYNTSFLTYSWDDATYGFLKCSYEVWDDMKLWHPGQASKAWKMMELSRTEQFRIFTIDPKQNVTEKQHKKTNWELISIFCLDIYSLMKSFLHVLLFWFIWWDCNKFIILFLGNYIIYFIHLFCWLFSFIHTFILFYLWVCFILLFLEWFFSDDDYNDDFPAYASGFSLTWIFGISYIFSSNY